MKKCYETNKKLKKIVIKELETKLISKKMLWKEWGNREKNDLNK